MTGKNGMAIADLLSVLRREYPNGVSFDPMTVRLMRKKIPFEDWQIEDLKGAMFQLKNGLWFSSGMILDDEPRQALEKQAMEWLMKQGCFSAERLLEVFRGVVCHIATPEDCAGFLQHLGFTVTAWGEGGHLCTMPPPNLNDGLAAISETIAGRLEVAGGTLSLNEIEQTMPHLTSEALEGIRLHFLQEVFKAEVGGVPCWRSVDSITFPDDFPEKMTTIVDTLVKLKESITATKLEFALNLVCGTRLLEEYSIPDKDTLMRVCAKYYQGENNVFTNYNKPRLKAKESTGTVKRVRGDNTLFSTLNVPIGAELVFTKDHHIICMVLDDENQVEYNGKQWAISTLATDLLGVSSANGFRYFKYKGEILTKRRMRLEQIGKKGKN